MMVMWRCRGDDVDCLVCKIERDGMRSKMRAVTGEDLEEEEEEESAEKTEIGNDEDGAWAEEDESIADT
jgi:hypothetical protein